MADLESDDDGASSLLSPGPSPKQAAVKEKLFYARSEGGSSDTGRSPARSAAGPSSPAVQHGAPMTAKGKARLAGAAFSSPRPPKLKAGPSPAKVKTPAVPAKGKKPVAPPKPKLKVARKATSVTQAHLGPASRDGETDKVSLTVEGRFETIRRGADGLFACKSCVAFSTNFADKMRARYERCVKGQTLDPGASDPSDPSSVERSSEDAYSSAAEPDDDFQTVVKTAARSTGRKWGPAAAAKGENGVGDGGVKYKKLSGPKAVGIAGGSRVKKPDRKPDKKSLARKPPARSPSPPPPLSVSPKKRKAPAAQPVPTTRAAKAIKAEGASSRPNGRDVASSSDKAVALSEGASSDDDDDRLITVEPRLRLRVVKINDGRERFLVDEKGNFWCQHCRIFTCKMAEHLIEHRKGGSCQAKLQRK